MISVSGAIVVSLNIMMLVIYWNYAGMPFKSDQHSNNLRHYGYVAIYWTLAYVVKYSTNFVPALNMSKKTEDKDVDKSTLVFFVLIYFAITVVCDILPFVVLLDSQFIRISTFDLVYLWDKELEDNKDLENKMQL